MFIMELGKTPFATLRGELKVGKRVLSNIDTQRIERLCLPISEIFQRGDNVVWKFKQIPLANGSVFVEWFLTPNAQRLRDVCHTDRFIKLQVLDVHAKAVLLPSVRRELLRTLHFI